MFQTRDWFCGHLRAIGHGKDVIIRGGDNIPVVEVESLLCRHPANAMATIQQLDPVYVDVTESTAGKPLSRHDWCRF